MKIFEMENVEIVHVHTALSILIISHRLYEFMISVGKYTIHLGNL